ncbi:MAG: porin family protein [Draconibacterium sp.]
MKTEMNLQDNNMICPEKRKTNAMVNRMNNKLLLLALILISGVEIATAQEGFNWGLKAGMNASTQSEIGNICDNNNLIAGFNGGLAGRYGFNDWLGVRSGLDFQMKGTKCEVAGIDVTNRLNYLLLPVKAEFSAGEKAGFKNGQRLFFATGPYAGYLLNAKAIKDDVTVDLDTYNDFDFGWSFELGYKIPVNKSNALQFSLNYDMGISEVADDTDSENKSASFNVAWLF